jgi:hypothetical protein
MTFNTKIIFNYSKEDAHLRRIFKIKTLLQKLQKMQYGKLGYSQASWQTQFCQTTELLRQLCEEQGETRQSIEERIILMRREIEEQRPRDWGTISENIANVMAHIEQQIAPAREVVKMRGSGLNFTEIQKQLPNRAFFSIKEDYLRFLQRIVGNSSYEYLRKGTINGS